MTGVLILMSLILLGTGALALWKPDTMWAVTRWRNSAEGLASQRNATWEGFNTWGGVLALTAGLACLGGAVVSGIVAHAHDQQLALLDSVRIECTQGGVALSNVGNEAVQVKLGRLRAVAGDLESKDFDYGSRHVLLAPDASGFALPPVDKKHGEVTLARGDVDRVPIAIPSDAHCNTAMPAFAGASSCRALEFQLTISEPGNTGTTLWRDCRFRE